MSIWYFKWKRIYYVIVQWLFIFKVCNTIDVIFQTFWGTEIFNRMTVKKIEKIEQIKKKWTDCQQIDVSASNRLFLSKNFVTQSLKEWMMSCKHFLFTLQPLLVFEVFFLRERSFDCKSCITQFPPIYYKLKIVFVVTNIDDNRESLYGSNWKWS